jgi:hypothetical protein
MDRIVVYTDNLDVETIARAVKNYEIVPVSGIVELARAIVERSRVIALVIETIQIDSTFGPLLSSIKKTFPLLQICLINPSGSGSESMSPAILDYTITGTGDHLAKELKTFIAGIHDKERRDHPRFDWPLQGSLSVDGKNWQNHKLWAISADGAFLESPTDAPAKGSSADLRITFQNSRMTTSCEVLDRRPPSLRLPAGFAVRFTDLSEDSMLLIDRIIQDALVQTLMEPEGEPEVPTLGAEDLTIPGLESL